jgi:hypothetical protein
VDLWTVFLITLINQYGSTIPTVRFVVLLVKWHNKRILSAFVVR